MNRHACAALVALIVVFPLSAFADEAAAPVDSAVAAPEAVVEAPAAAAAPAPADGKPMKTWKTGEPLNPWTDCGIGAMLFTKVKWAAVISNVIWDYGTTATTSATSSKHTCEGQVVAVAQFIDATYVRLEEDTVTGGGDHLAALLNIRGCAADAHAAISSSLRTGLGHALQDAGYADRSPVEKAQAYYQLLETTVSGQYAAQCGA